MVPEHNLLEFLSNASLQLQDLLNQSCRWSDLGEATDPTVLGTTQEYIVDNYVTLGGSNNRVLVRYETHDLNDLQSSYRCHSDAMSQTNALGGRAECQSYYVELAIANPAEAPQCSAKSPQRRDMDFTNYVDANFPESAPVLLPDYQSQCAYCCWIATTGQSCAALPPEPYSDYRPVCQPFLAENHHFRTDKQ